MNPSIHFDGETWRCLLRCADYAMPDGVTIRSHRAEPGEARTKNVMVIFDPEGWKPLEIYKMRERDDLPRAPCSSVGFEDIRLFQTSRGGLQGIAASLHLQRDSVVKHPRVEQVIVSFDAEYNIVAAHPIRGSAWSEVSQKNWSPFDRAIDPRFLYSIGRGTLFDAGGELTTSTPVQSVDSTPVPHAPSDRARDRAQERATDREKERSKEERRRPRPENQMYDAVTPKLDGLRGGSQLVCIAEDTWLGIGHEMQLVNKRKLYHHVWYVVDSCGKLKVMSPAMKIVPNRGIEFVAGMAIDGDRVVLSYGIDDMESAIAETSLAAVLELMGPIAQQ